MADALTAARLLHLEAEPDLVILMELLGLRRDDQPTVPPARRRPTPDYPESPTQVGQRTPDETGVPATSAPTGVRTVAEPLPPEPVRPIDYSTADPLDPGPPGSGSVAYEPIVPLHQLRAAITMIIRRPRRSIEVDIEAAVELVAEQRPLEQLPRLVEHTLDRGVTIVADVGPEMLPYLEDVAHLRTRHSGWREPPKPGSSGSRTATRCRCWIRTGRSWSSRRSARPAPRRARPGWPAGGGSGPG